MLLSKACVLPLMQRSLGSMNSPSLLVESNALLFLIALDTREGELTGPPSWGSIWNAGLWEGGISREGDPGVDTRGPRPPVNTQTVLN